MENTTHHNSVVTSISFIFQYCRGKRNTITVSLVGMTVGAGFFFSLLLFTTNAVSAQEVRVNAGAFTDVPHTDTADADKADTSSSNQRTIAATSENQAQEQQTEQEYISPVFTSDFSFNGVGLQWKMKEQADSKTPFELYINVDHQGWIQLPASDEQSKKGYSTTDPFFITGKQIQYKIVGSDIESFSEVQVLYFDSRSSQPQPTTESTRSIQLSSQGIAAADTNTDLTPHIITREEWGADESIRHWDPEYKKPKKFVVHHTASSGDLSDGPAVVRGIYYYHTQVLGWGDIGYNYVIDQQGNVYQGRYGGNGVIGAHVYNSATQTNYNVGSIGISLMGCFEDTQGACSTVSEFNPQMQNALAELIGRKSKKLRIDPAGSGWFINTEIKNIVGHRDLDYTYCPGNLVKKRLPSIRHKALSYYRHAKSAASVHRATIVEDTMEGEFQAISKPTFSFAYTNSGGKEWLSDRVVLRVKIKNTSTIQDIPLAENVAVGAEGRVDFEWNALPQDPGTYTITTQLVRKNGIPIYGSKSEHTITIVE